MLSRSSGDPAAARRQAPLPAGKTSDAARPAPSDRDTVDPIQSDPSQTNQHQSTLARFAKETLGFQEINPQSLLVQKYLQNSPIFYVLALDFFTQSPFFYQNFRS